MIEKSALKGHKWLQQQLESSLKAVPGAAGAGLLARQQPAGLSLQAAG
jgi:hypothetical protein